MTLFLRTVFAWTLLLQIASVAKADDFVPIPTLTERVTDAANVLSVVDRKGLEVRLEALEISKGAQLAILLVDTTQPESIEQYSLRVVEQWKLGRKKIDDGVLLLLAMKDRAFRLEVGYGLEGALSDATSKRILEEILKPFLQKGDVAGGLNASVDAITKVISGEPLPVPSSMSGLSDGDIFDTLMPLVASGLFLSSILSSFGVKSRVTAAFITGVLAAIVGTILVSWMIGAIGGGVIFVLSLLGGTSSGGFSSRSGSRSSGGGFSGGGGSFGGGGASGRW